MKASLSLLALALLAGCAAIEKTAQIPESQTSIEEQRQSWFSNRMLPAVKQFIVRNELPLDSATFTNAIAKWQIHFPSHWSGVVGSVTLSNRCSFSFISDRTHDEVWIYRDGTRTSFNLANAPQEKTAAVRALSMQNRLREPDAVQLAKHYFHLQGHKDADFHPPEFGQFTWGERDEPDFIPYPFYGARWYRKDVTREDRESGSSDLPSVVIEISGVRSNMVSYGKYNIPIGFGRDFAPEVRPWLKRNTQR